MSNELLNWIALLVAVMIAVLLLHGSFSLGVTLENQRLYRKCLVEQQDKTDKEAVELCKERTKE